jgi:hypothetical protein
MRRAYAILLLLAVATGCSGEPSEAEAAVPDVAVEPTGTSLPSEAPDVDGLTPQAATAPPVAPAPEPEPPGLAAVREYTEMFYRGELDPLFDRFSEEMREVLPRERLGALYDHAVKEFGREARIIGQDAQTKGDYRAFVRWARFDGTRDVIEIQWILRPDDTVAGFYIRPARKRVRGEGDGAIQP